MTSNPACPFCKCKKVIPSGDRQFFCTKCKATYEPDVEGIDPTANPRDPSRRAEYQDEQRKRQQDRLGRR